MTYFYFVLVGKNRGPGDASGTEVYRTFNYFPEV